MNRSITVWNTDEANACTIRLTPPARPNDWLGSGPVRKLRFLELPIHANVKSMLFVQLRIQSPEGEPLYETRMIVEWAGEQLIHILVPEGCAERAIEASFTAEAGEYTIPGTILTFGPAAWLAQRPLVSINASECLLDLFTNDRYYSLDMWNRVGLASGNTAVQLPRGSLGQEWNYAQLWIEGSVRSGNEWSGATGKSGESGTIEINDNSNTSETSDSCDATDKINASEMCDKGGTYGTIAYSRLYDHDIGDFQAFVACVSLDSKARFSLYLTIDGVTSKVIDRKRGAGLEELRVPIEGKKLTRVTIELAGSAAETDDCPDSGHPDAGRDRERSVAHLYWLMFERKGADPALTHEITGIGPISDPERIESVDTHGLPLGLLFDREGLAALKRKIRSGEAKRLFEEIVAEADANLSYRPESYVGVYFPLYWANQGVERSTTPHEQTRRWFSTLVYNSLAYLLTGRPEYGLSARRALLSVIRVKEWCGGFISRYLNGIIGYRATFHESHIVQAVALCYDFIGNLLSPDERRAVEDAVYEKAIPALDMYLRLNRDGYLMNSNQGFVYASGIIYACLVARKSHPDAEHILTRQSEWLLRMAGHYYKPDGTTNEGMMYWEYSTFYAAECLLLLSRYRNMPVTDLAPAHLHETMRYVLHMRSQHNGELTFLPLGDCRTDRFLFMGPSLLFFAGQYGDDNAYWMWHRYYNRPNLPGGPFYGAVNSTGQYTTNALHTLLLYEEREVAPPALPDIVRFACDRIIWRTGQGETDTMLFFEGGPQSFEHAHFDKGQFIIQAYGEYLAADPGMIDYSRPGHVLYVKSSYHNIATVRGADQSYKDADRAVVIRDYANDRNYNFIYADLSGSYRELEKYDRLLLFVRPDYFLVLDDISAPGGGIEWNFHSKGKLRASGERSLAAEAEKAGLTLHYDCNVPLSSRFGQYEDGGNVMSYNVVLAPDEQVKRIQIAAVLAPYPRLRERQSASVPAVTSKRIPGGTVFTVTGPWGSDDVIVRLGDMPPEWNGSQLRETIRIVRQNGGRTDTKSFG